jgi:hypothetical protein
MFDHTLALVLLLMMMLNFRLQKAMWYPTHALQLLLTSASARTHVPGP